MSSIEELKHQIAKQSKEGKIFSLEFDIGQKKYQIKQLKKVSKENLDEIKFIEDLSIMVHVNGQDIPVNRKNIANFDDNQQLIKFRLEELQMDLNDYQKELKELKNNG